MSAFSPITLRTPRLTLRQPDAGDVAAMFAIRSDPEVTRYWSGSPWQSLEEAAQWLEGVEAGHRDGSALQFVIDLRDSTRTIGGCTLFNFHRGCRRAEIGYLLGRPYWGRGYMNEALRAMIAHAFGALSLRRLEADIDPDNIASARSLERLGFRHEGRLRERWEVEGQISDSDVYGLLRSEWNAEGT